MAKDFKSDYKYSKVKNDKYSAVWLSHSSISDYKKCHRLYFLKNIWKNTQGRKVNIVSPAMSLGSAVHAVIEPLANVKTENRFDKNLLEIYEEIWPKFSGLKGGFISESQEMEYKAKGIKMLENVIANKGPLSKKTVKFYDGDFIPNIYLSEEENVILCGLVDWVEYIQESDTLRVIDFKTGQNFEKEDSYQLYLYKILVEALQKRKVSSAAYWYLDKEKTLTNKEIIDEDIEEIEKEILQIGIEIKNKKESARNKEDMENAFPCSSGEANCYMCRDIELVRNYVFDCEDVQYVGMGEYKQDLYLIKK